jgi:hypothetical protein
MTIEVVAEVIQSMYYDGRVISNDQKLEKKDFQQLVFAAMCDVGRIEWYQEAQRGNQDFYWAQALTSDTFVVAKDSGRYMIDMSERGIMPLPRGAGIIRLYPDTDEDVTYTTDLLKVPPGAETFYMNPKILEDTGMKCYVQKGEKLEVCGFKEDDKITAEYIPKDIALDLPEGLANAIIKDVMTSITPDQSKSVDNTEDGDPNINTYKLRLDDPKTI